jgi:methyl-accepting chemotaxis protein
MFGRYVVGAGQLLGELGGAGAALAGSSDELTDSSSSVAEESSAQAAAVEEISATLREFSVNMRLSNDRLGSLKSRQLAQMRTVLGEIQTSGALMNATMKEIGESSHAITRIVKTIEEIAFQTNILALNAAVEAARAGEVGAGFAVVAGEVRMLAGRAAEAAQETGSLVTLAARRGTEGARVNDEVSSRLTTVQGAFQELDGLLEEVTQALSQQVAGVDQITMTIQTIDKNAQTGCARSEGLSATAAMLREQATQISGAIGELARITGNSS